MNEYRKHFEYLNEAKLLKVAIEDILPDKDNMEVAVDSLRKGMYSDDTKPLDVYKSDDKYILADGHHRLLKSIIDGEAYVTVNVRGDSTNRADTVELDFYNGDYYGLDTSLENGWLIKRL